MAGMGQALPRYHRLGKVRIQFSERRPRSCSAGTASRRERSLLGDTGFAQSFDKFLGDLVSDASGHIARKGRNGGLGMGLPYSTATFARVFEPAKVTAKRKLVA